MLFAALAGTFAVYTWSEKQIDQANDLRHRSFLLADELRHSSDDLTRMARTYTVTGDVRYRTAYQAILDIRDGKQARPQDYQNVYWDLVLASAQTPPVAHGQTIALLDLMRQAGFTPQELAMMAQAKANSDQLATTETVAMRMVDDKGPLAHIAHNQAHEMLYNDAYHQAKASIMQPIKAVSSLMDQRTSQRRWVAR